MVLGAWRGVQVHVSVVVAGGGALSPQRKGDLPDMSDKTIN